MPFYSSPIYSDELYHHGVLGMKWGIRRYQPYPKGERVKGGKEVGAATKVKQRTDIKEFRKTRREVTAATRNSKSRTKDVEEATARVKEAEKNYEKAWKKVVMPWGQKKKRTRILEAEKELDRERSGYERSLQKQEQAEEIRKSALDRMKSQAESYVKKYGSTKLTDIKPSTVKLGKDLVAETFKTNVNLANLPVIGQVVSGKTISRLERERKEKETMRRVKKRRDIYDY